MKKVLIILATAVLVLSACKFGNSSNEEVSKTGWALQKRQLSSNLKKVTSIIVKTDNNFDATAFERAGLIVDGSADIGSITWWFVKDPEGYAVKKVSRVVGVLNVASNEIISGWDKLPKPDKPDENGSSKPKHDPETTLGLPDGNNNNLDPTDAYKGYSFGKITGAKQAYEEFDYGTKEVLIAVIDTGVKKLHQDLDGVLLYERSCSQKFQGEYIGDGKKFTDVPQDESWDTGGHGTHVTGTMAALGNGKDTNGVAWKNTKVISYQSLGVPDGSGYTWSIYGALLDLTNVVKVLRQDPDTRDEEILPSYLKGTGYYLEDQSVVPVNMSLGGNMSNPFNFDVINYALENGVLPVIAMGNEGTHTNSYPAALPGIISVGACNGSYERAGFSTKGHWITISAPGSGIESTYFGSTEGTQQMSGTSMATPFVTGSLGYLLSFDGPMRSASPQQIKDLLRQTAVQPGATSPDPTVHNEEFGYGIINVYNAAKIVTEKTNFPHPNDFYKEDPVIFKAKHTNGSDIDLESINILDNQGRSILNIASYGNSDGAIGREYKNKEIKIYGLEVGKTYTVMASATADGSEIFADTFTVNGSAGSQEVVCTFSQHQFQISTVRNLAYNEGNDPTDTIIELYKIVGNGLRFIAGYDYNLLDTLVVPYDAGEYLAVVYAYEKAEGNYVLCIGSKSDPNTPIELNYSGEYLEDGNRSATDPDSYEPNDDPESAIAKGDVWGQKLACNLIGEDEDIFYFVVPELP